LTAITVGIVYDVDFSVLKMRKNKEWQQREVVLAGVIIA
jgi:hypothetical protein